MDKRHRPDVLKLGGTATKEELDARKFSHKSIYEKRLSTYLDKTIIQVGELDFTEQGLSFLLLPLVAGSTPFMTFTVPMLPAGALQHSRTSSTPVDPPASPIVPPRTTPASAKVMDKRKNRKTEFSIAVANLESSSTEKIAVIKEFAQKYTTSQRIFMPLPWPVTSQSYSMSFPKR
jgi:hypothetical protein